ncbi:MAG: hypothetical protein QXJ45_01695 [Thermoproteota archaeon]
MISSDFAGKAYFNNYFILVLGIAISVIFFAINIPIFSEPRAESIVANKLGAESSIKYCEEILSEARKEKLEGRKGLIAMTLLGYAGLLEVGPAEYVERISQKLDVFYKTNIFRYTMDSYGCRISRIYLLVNIRTYALIVFHFIILYFL